MNSGLAGCRHSFLADMSSTHADVTLPSYLSAAWIGRLKDLSLLFGRQSRKNWDRDQGRPLWAT